MSVREHVFLLFIFGINEFVYVLILLLHQETRGSNIAKTNFKNLQYQHGLFTVYSYEFSILLFRFRVIIIITVRAGIAESV
jgi:hypothetical protein